MTSVTQRIKQIRQPYGGYIKPSELKKIQIEDNNQLSSENISSSLVGLTVDYMTRYLMGSPIKEAFKISLIGAVLAHDGQYALSLANKITGSDDNSIYYACKLVGYDVCYRAGLTAYKDVRTIEADKETINNIRIMINRSIKFFEKYGPIVKDGFNFTGGYTDIINTGDGDFLTEDTLWDFKVSANEPKSAHTLQLLIYYIMGKNSIYKEFNNIEKIGIFNPRLNCVYIMNIKNIPQETLDIVANEVIGYNANKIDKTTPNNLLSMKELTETLQCSRYKIIKMYEEEKLPLIKVKNQYYIDRNDLITWIEQKEESEQKIALLYILLYITIGIIITVLLLLF